MSTIDWKEKEKSLNSKMEIPFEKENKSPNAGLEIPNVK